LKRHIHLSNDKHYYRNHLHCFSTHFLLLVRVTDLQAFSWVFRGLRSGLAN